MTILDVCIATLLLADTGLLCRVGLLLEGGSARVHECLCIKIGTCISFFLSLPSPLLFLFLPSSPFAPALDQH